MGGIITKTVMRQLWRMKPMSLKYNKRNIIEDIKFWVDFNNTWVAKRYYEAGSS